MIKKKIYFRKNKCLKKKIIIGVIGTHKGVGVTHFSIMIANYFQNIMKRKTAYLEYNNSNDIIYLHKEYEEIILNDNIERFKINNLYYYPNITKQNFSLIINENFEIYVVDMGVNNLNDEFLLCDIKIVIGNMIEWKKDYLINFIENCKYISNYRDWVYFLMLGNEIDKKRFQKEFNIPIHIIGYEPDLYHISNATFNLFQKTLILS